MVLTHTIKIYVFAFASAVRTKVLYGEAGPVYNLNVIVTDHLDDHIDLFHFSTDLSDFTM